MVDLEQFREAVKQAYGYYPVVVDGELHNQRDADRFAGFRLLSIIDNAGKVECAKPAPVDGESTGALTMGQRAVAFELLRCCVSWAPNVCVLGNVRAKDAADLMRSILARQPAPVVDDGGLSRSLKLAAAEEQAEAWQAVCSILNELRPNWAVGHGSGINLALNAIRSLSAPVADDAMVERALNAKVGNWPVRQLFDSDYEARIAMRAALSSVQGVGNG